MTTRVRRQFTPIRRHNILSVMYVNKSKSHRTKPNKLLTQAKSYEEVRQETEWTADGMKRNGQLQSGRTIGVKRPFDASH
jgi:hypothetical protein